MKKRVRFGDLAIGDSFEFASKGYKKVTDRRGQSQAPRNEAIFTKTDLVHIEVFDIEEDDGAFYPMYGITGSGSANPNLPPLGGSPMGGLGSSNTNTGTSPQHNTSPIYTDEELEDMYGIDWDQMADRCN
jgi:hypothetical protein